jgi:hypothetical protein
MMKKAARISGFLDCEYWEDVGVDVGCDWNLNLIRPEYPPAKSLKSHEL